MKYQVGQIVEGKVTGIQPYGAFVSLDEKANGLIHISEISDGYVRDIERFVHVGDIICVKILDYDAKENRAKLSLKAVSRKRRKMGRRIPVRKASLPPMQIGFSSIRKQMNVWIKNAERKLNDHD